MDLIGECCKNTFFKVRITKIFEICSKSLIRIQFFRKTYYFLDLFELLFSKIYSLFSNNYSNANFRKNYSLKIRVKTPLRSNFRSLNLNFRKYFHFEFKFYISNIFKTNSNSFFFFNLHISNSFTIKFLFFEIV